MARQFAKICVDIAEDEDLEGLSSAAQWLYFRVLLPDASLNLAGVGLWRPKRFVNKSADADMDLIIGAAYELDRSRFVYFDDDTEEYLIRSLVRRDETLKNWKYAIAVVRGYRETASKRLRAAIVSELRRISEENPGYKCWSIEETKEDLAGILSRSGWNEDEHGDYQSSYQCGYQAENPRTLTPWNLGTLNPKPGTVEPSNPPTEAATGLMTASGHPAPRKRVADLEYTPEFENWWTWYPKKVGKGGAFKAWRKAERKAGVECLMASVQVYAQSREGKDHQYTPNPSKWLNEERWLDEPVETKPKISLADKLAEKAREIQEQNYLKEVGGAEHKQLE